MPSPGHIHLHIVICTKYRLPFLWPEIEAEVERILYLKAAEFGCEITRIGYEPDHVHILIQVPHTVRVCDVVRHMKGRSSFTVRQRWPWLRECRAFWQKRYFACSVGPRSRRRIARYLAHQQGA